ncbi:DUF4878 domain-containing protein [Aquifex aeolicus]|uniref:Uncharacterized protein aq_142 n=1 Tax=Aquifex aeolicus (strain VF5) TaxID=224324 RepID=Y142_AQUAE|nr:DUF4878 domain-containing protein [Aquifex aeolicus]O66537.1 RecName: Full=Uncharacterized protein aq_142 [Aquifex aeolicus VF5]AAC06501.1 putative protein [Aquifex aeolicus VF5]
MRNKVLIVLAVIAGALILKSCGEPYSGAKETVGEFMEEIAEGEGRDAIKYLYPAYRDELAKNFKLPVQFTEMKPSEVLACVLSTMGRNIDEVEIKKAIAVNPNTANVVVKVEDKEGIEKFFSFTVVKEGDKWYIAKIEKYIPQVGR